MRKDTVFIKREFQHGVYHAIFISADPASQWYKEISNFDIDKADSVSYKNSLQYFKEKGLQLSPVNTGDFPKRWIILYQYRGKFYTYNPSDFYTHYRAAVTTDGYISYTGEGPDVFKILSFRKINKSTYQAYRCRQGTDCTYY